MELQRTQVKIDALYLYKIYGDMFHLSYTQSTEWGQARPATSAGDVRRPQNRLPNSLEL